MEVDPDFLDVRRAELGEIIGLRHRVLRPGKPVSTAHFEGDDAPSTVHVGAFDVLANRCIGCATLMERPLEGEPTGAWQLRGMAVDPGVQGQGVGRALIAGIVEMVVAERAGRMDAPTLMWCNARHQAVPFYAASGWKVCSERFEVPGIGPHYRMRCPVPEASGAH